MFRAHTVRGQESEKRRRRLVLSPLGFILTRPAAALLVQAATLISSAGFTSGGKGLA